jgi:hypothetical protein
LTLKGKRYHAKRRNIVPIFPYEVLGVRIYIRRRFYIFNRTDRADLP